MAADSAQPTLFAPLEPSPAGEPPVAFEDLIAELDKLVGQLEAGSLSLEDSLKAFERGMALSKRASTILDAAEHRIEQLTGTPDAPALKPFEDAAF
ncbi:MAG: exodeoxyribonuclease VII small subunit [Myxococcota bacterium]